MGKYVNSATALLPLLVLVAALGVCHADVKSGLELKQFLKAQMPVGSVTDHQVSNIPEISFDLPQMTLALVELYEQHKTRADEVQQYRDEHFGTPLADEDKRPVSDGEYSCMTLEQEALMTKRNADNAEWWNGVVAAANASGIPTNETEPVMETKDNGCIPKRFFIEPNGHRLNLSDWKDNMYFEQTYVDLTKSASFLQEHVGAALRDRKASVSKCIENPMFSDRCRYYSHGEIVDSGLNVTSEEREHFLNWQQNVHDQEQEARRHAEALGIGYETYHKKFGTAGRFRSTAANEFRNIGLDRITDLIHRQSVINREMLYIMGTAETSWKMLRGRFDELESLNTQAIAASKYSYGMDKDYFLLAFSLANIPITIINLLLHFVVKRQMNKYSL